MNSRNLQYKLFDRELNKIFDVICINIQTQTTEVLDEDSSIHEYALDDKSVLVLPATGKLDKNKSMLFEGDIVKGKLYSSKDDLGIIAWNTRSGKFGVHMVLQGKIWDNKTYSLRGKKFERMGNINSPKDKVIFELKTGKKVPS